MAKSLVYEKSVQFALNIISLCETLDQKKSFVIARQILKSGTSIGANISEALYAQSSKDFAHKMHIALKETSETRYWLRLLHRSGKISSVQYKYLDEHCSELRKMISSIILTTKNKITLNS